MGTTDDCAVHATQLVVLCRCGIHNMTGQRQETHLQDFPAVCSLNHISITIWYIKESRRLQPLPHQVHSLHGLCPGCARHSCTHVKPPTYQIPCVHTYEPYKSKMLLLHGWYLSLFVLHSHWLLLLLVVADSLQVFSVLDIWEVKGTHQRVSCVFEQLIHILLQCPLGHLEGRYQNKTSKTSEGWIWKRWWSKWSLIMGPTTVRRINQLA